MKIFIFDIFNKLLGSLDTTTKKSFSARKLSALTGIIVSIIITIKHSNDLNIVNLVMIWLGFVLICLGLVTMEQLTKLRGTDNSSQQ